jgi:hypothetical protein
MKSKHMESILLLIVISLLCWGSALPFTPPAEGFQLDPAGISVSSSVGHLCVISQRQGGGIGGRVLCTGNKKEKKTKAPKNVRTDF